ncbi:MAG: aminopeptidase [Gammaproteobacteria bacterium]
MRFVRSILAVALLLPLSGCYYMQAFSGQMEILAKRQPIAKVIAHPATEPTLRERLEYVQAAREFASRELGLPDNGSYRSYADLQRPFVVWNVFAAHEFSIEPKRWCFPIAGCVVYRGYFNADMARAYARRLERRGYDAAVGGVVAYSTLGHLDDPVLSTMLKWDNVQLAATLFHELAHQVVYVPGDSDFNEGFATVVEEAGLERWLRSRGELHQLESWRQQRARARQFIALLLRTRERLKTLYASDLPPEEMRARKQYEFGVLKVEYEQLKREWGGYPGYDAWFARTLNNAHLVSVATYHGCVPRLRRVLDSLGGDLEKFYSEMKALKGPQGAEQRARLCRGE